jgi:hypothetical protein
MSLPIPLMEGSYCADTRAGTMTRPSAHSEVGHVRWMLGTIERRCGVCVEVLLVFLRTLSRAPYRTPPACAKRAAYPDPPIVPHPESIADQAAYTETLITVFSESVNRKSF